MALCIAFICIECLPQLHHQVYMHIVAKHLLEQGDPIRVTCVVTDLSPGHAGRDGRPDRPAKISVYVSGPMFCQMDITGAPAVTLACNRTVFLSL
jgi:hypothetical protein